MDNLNYVNDYFLVYFSLPNILDISHVLGTELMAGDV